MKREDVKNKIPGITEEQLNWLMQENGSDITREKFLSTLSLRRATVVHTVIVANPMLFLSTLSLRRATSRAKAIPAKVGDFYPRSPCGERLMTTGIKLPKPRFLSTLSLRRATNPLWLMGYDVGFLSTLSLRRATL